jgi:hypothetical protein
VAPLESGFDLLDLPGGLVGPQTYVNQFAGYRWTRIVGYPNLVEFFHSHDERFPTIRALKEHIAGQRQVALGSVPAGWVEKFEDGANWNECTRQQIMEACVAGALRFDKACIAIKTLELVFTSSRSEVLSALDIYKFIKLRPAIYYLTELDPRTLAFLDGGNLTEEEKGLQRALIESLSPKDNHDNDLERPTAGRAFLKEIAAGFTATYPNVMRIAEFIGEQQWPKPRIAALQSRTDPMRRVRKLRCNAFEGPFVALAEEQLDELQAMKGAAHKRGQPLRAT